MESKQRSTAVTADSLVEQAAAKKKGIEFILPTDVIIANKFAEDAESKVVPVENIPNGWMVRPIMGCALCAWQTKTWREAC